MEGKELTASFNEMAFSYKSFEKIVMFGMILSSSLRIFCFLKKGFGFSVQI